MIVIIFRIVINDIAFDNTIATNSDIAVNRFDVVCESKVGGFNVSVYGNQAAVNFSTGAEDDITINRLDTVALNQLLTGFNITIHHGNPVNFTKIANGNPTINGGKFIRFYVIAKGNATIYRSQRTYLSML